MGLGVPPELPLREGGPVTLGVRVGVGVPVAAAVPVMLGLTPCVRLEVEVAVGLLLLVPLPVAVPLAVPVRRGVRLLLGVGGGMLLLGVPLGDRGKAPRGGRETPLKLAPPVARASTRAGSDRVTVLN